jgi:hypothetical protein
MKKIYTTILATIAIASAVNAKTYVATSGKWTDATVWGNEYPGTTIKSDDIVVIKGQMTMNTSIVVEGTLQVDKGAAMFGMKDLMITTTGKFENNGNTVMKRIINEGTINNNLIMEAMMDFDNKGKVTNNNNVVAGANFINAGGTAEGNGGTYFANNTVVASSAAKFGNDVRVFTGNQMETAAASSSSSLSLDASFSMNAVTLNVINPTNTDVVLFSVEKSNDGRTFQIAGMVNAKKDVSVAMTYTDTNINSSTVYYRVKAISSNGNESTLPIASVKVPTGEQAFSMITQ